jgi:hypothetical protein
MRAATGAGRGRVPGGCVGAAVAMCRGSGVILVMLSDVIPGHMFSLRADQDYQGQKGREGRLFPAVAFRSVDGPWTAVLPPHELVLCTRSCWCSYP